MAAIELWAFGSGGGAEGLKWRSRRNGKTHQNEIQDSDPTVAAATAAAAVANPLKKYGYILYHFLLVFKRFFPSFPSPSRQSRPCALFPITVCVLSLDHLQWPPFRHPVTGCLASREKTTLCSRARPPKRNSRKYARLKQLGTAILNAKNASNYVHKIMFRGMIMFLE